MGIFDSVLYRGMKRGKAKYITQTENSIPEYILFLSHAHTYAKIITGEADPKFYEDYRVVETFKRLLLGNMDISFLFHKESPFEAGLEKLMAENDSLCEFKKECPSKLHLYWAPKRPTAHYAVVDSIHFLLESKHTHGGKRDVLIEYDKPEEAGEWDERFNQFVLKQSIKEVQIGDLK